MASHFQDIFLLITVNINSYILLVYPVSICFINILLFHFHWCVWFVYIHNTYIYMHMCFHVFGHPCVCFCMSMHACGGFRLMFRIIINRSSTLTTEAESLTQTQSWPIWSITSKLALGNPLWGWNYRQATTPIQIYPVLGISTLVLILAW